MIDTIKKSDCTGCKMCGDICPENAISFECDSEGFWYPRVNQSKCTQCSLCVKKCPSLSEFTYSKNNSETPKSYAAKTLDDNLRINSTSGGIYGELAKYILSLGGYIAGVVFDDDLVAKHIVSKDVADYSRIIRSKYFQSDTKDIYVNVREILKKGELVLFCGTPCQSAALLSFLNKKYENLITCDFICRGNVSPKSFRKYKSYLENKYKSNIKEIHFKNKTIGWNQFGTKVVFENGKTYFKDRDNDLFILAYIYYRLFLRPCCFECKFKQLPRVSDITFGDFWGVAENVSPSLDDNKGTSAVILNSENGEWLFNQISKCIASQETTIDQIHAGNACLFKSAIKGEKSDIVFENIDKYAYDVLLKKFCKKKSFVEKIAYKIKRFLFNN